MKTEIHERFASTLPANDDHPYRTGAWRPQTTEYDAWDLEVEGEIPRDLAGVYLRNTENPLLAPIERLAPALAISATTMSGKSKPELGVILEEAPLNSGSTISANLVLENGKIASAAFESKFPLDSLELRVLRGVEFHARTRPSSW